MTSWISSVCPSRTTVFPFLPCSVPKETDLFRLNSLPYFLAFNQVWPMGSPQEEIEGRRKSEVRIFIPLLSPSRAPPAGCVPSTEGHSFCKGGSLYTTPSGWWNCFLSLAGLRSNSSPAVTSPALHYPSGFPYTLLTPKQSLICPASSYPI